MSAPSDPLRSVRVLTKRQAFTNAGVSEDTWDRLEAKGDTPPKTRLSERRIGYRQLDFEAWLDARRERPLNEARDIT
jgi:predicted DNA-binding transcriptional regulator AlpA